MPTVKVLVHKGSIWERGPELENPDTVELVPVMPGGKAGVFTVRELAGSFVECEMSEQAFEALRVDDGITKGEKPHEPESDPSGNPGSGEAGS